MNEIDILFGISNGLFLAASYPMIKKVMINRESLNGFSFWGSFLTFGGMITTIFAFAYLKTWTSIILALPTVAYWGTVSYYSRKDIMTRKEAEVLK